MPRPLRIIFWFFCLEYLLALRVMYSLQSLFLLLLLMPFRWYAMQFVPMWEYYAFFVGFLAAFGGAHLYGAFSNRGKLRRRFLQLDGLGVPLVQLITRNWYLALLAELLVGGHIIYRLSQQPGWKFIPPRVSLSVYLQRYEWAQGVILEYAWQIELWIETHAKEFATWQPIFSLSMMTLWSVLEYRVLRVPNFRRKKEKEESFAVVTEHAHSLPELPDIKQLADELERLRGM